MKVVERSIDMKDLCVSMALIVAIALSAQASFAAWEGMQSLNPMPYISYLNPLPYFGIGENKTNFSFNPFTGFKNCDKCKVKRDAYCETKNTCDTCQKAITPRCNTCHREYVEPRCNSCGR